MNANGDSRPGPAYVAFPSLVTFFQQLKEHGIPSQIDKSVMSSFSGGTQSHLVSALRFLRLIGASNEPSMNLRPLVDTVGTDKFAAALRPVIESAYSDVLGDVDLASATPQQVIDKFREAKLEGSTLDKSMRFLLAALKSAEMAHSTHLGRRRKASGPRRERAVRRTADSENNGAVGTGITAITTGNESQGSGMIEFPVHLPGKPVGKIVVPKDITPTDCKLIEAQMAVITIYASQNREPTGHRRKQSADADAS